MTEPLARSRSEPVCTCGQMPCRRWRQLLGSCPGPLVEEHNHPWDARMVLGTRCNVCDRPLTVAGCPLCVTCCEREP